MMNNFWSLVRFEYQKVFSRKSVLAAIFLGVLIIAPTILLFVMGNDPVTGMSSYDTMRMDRAYDRALAGRPLDAALILEASKAYQKIPTDVYPYSSSEEYQQYARPYSSVSNLVDSAYAGRGKPFDVTDFQTISAEDANAYYEKRIAQYRANLENNALYSQNNIEKVLSLDNEVTKPFTMQYIGGYVRFFSFSATSAFTIMFLIGFILSPMFSEEYQRGMDSLILTSKNGKRSQIFAKLFTAFSFSTAMTVLFLAFGYLLCMMIYGFEGGNAQIQLHIPLLTYHFTMLECVGILFLTTLFGSFLMTGICIFLSSVWNKAAAVLAVCVIIIILGMVNGIMPPALEKIKYFLPSPMGTFYDVILTQLSFPIFGTQLMLYQTVCLAASITASILSVLAYRNFKHHQVG